jgi:hypothetical protein
MSQYADITLRDGLMPILIALVLFLILLSPFELSPEQSRSLRKIMVTGVTTGVALGAAGAGAKVGAAGGLAIGAPAGPLVFVTVPAGFVVGGLMGAVTWALGERYYERLRGRQADPREDKAELRAAMQGTTARQAT